MLCSVLVAAASKLRKRWIAACSLFGIFIAVRNVNTLGENDTSLRESKKKPEHSFFE
jgi:hypothetical protein